MDSSASRPLLQIVSGATFQVWVTLERLKNCPLIKLYKGLETMAQ